MLVPTNVKFYDSVKGKIIKKMLDTVNIYDASKQVTGSTGQSLCTMIIDIFKLHNIPTVNAVGFTADGASNLMGDYNSLLVDSEKTFQGYVL